MRNLYGQFIKPGDLVFNVGANVGTRTAVFLDLGAKVVAVEPQGALCDDLRRKFAGRDVEVVCAAVGPTEGEVVLHLCTDNMLATCEPGWAEALKDRWPKERWHKTVSVPQVTLDDLIQEHGFPSFIKIDVEGYEDRVLMGLTEPVRALSFEYTVPYIGPALLAVDLANDLGLTRFNYIIQETMQFKSPRWLNSEQMKAVLHNMRVETFYGDIFAVQEAVMAEEKKEPKQEKKAIGKGDLPDVPIVDGMIVGAAGKGIWCIDTDEKGKVVRRWVPDVVTQVKMGIGMHQIYLLFPEQLERIPEGEPMPRIPPRRIGSSRSTH